MSLKPIKETVYVLRDKAPRELPSGIYLGEPSEHPATGTIVAVSEKIPEKINIGAKAYFGKFAGHQVDSKYFEGSSSDDEYLKLNYLDIYLIDNDVN